MMGSCHHILNNVGQPVICYYTRYKLNYFLLLLDFCQHVFGKVDRYYKLNRL